MNKIKEILVEPNKIEVGSTFLLKIKAIRYLTYREIKENKTYTELKDLTFGQLKGD